MELIAHGGAGPGQIPDAESLHILNSDLLVVVHVQGVEERVHVFFLGVVAGVEHSVGVGQDWHCLS